MTMTKAADMLQVRAPAKLNLALAVGPPGVDGLHLICSWMVTLDLADEITLTRLEADRFSRYAVLWHEEALRRSEIDWPIQRDLAVRAHLALERAVGRRLPVQMKLEKRIPVGGGLGGGSSNAAAMLRAVNELFQLRLSQPALVSIARELGSDVAFLIRGGSAVVEGLGEKIEHHDDNGMVERHVVLIFPEFMCPTGAVYRAFDALGGREATLRGEAVRGLIGRAPLPSEALFNDLLPAALQVQPELEDIIEEARLLAERPVHLTGSGSTVFIPCDDAMHAEFLAAALTENLHMTAVAARTIGSTPRL